MMDNKLLYMLSNPSYSWIVQTTAVGYYLILTFGVLYTCIFLVYPAIYDDKFEIIRNTMFLGYIFFNMMGNYALGLLSKSNVKTGVILIDPPKSWLFCKKCQQHSPPRSHHCSICNACVLKRDHHCFFLCQCIGLKNQAYFIIFAFHVTVGSVYAAKELLTYLHHFYFPLQISIYSFFSYTFPGVFYNFFFTDIEITFATTLCLIVFYGCLSSGWGCMFLFITQCCLVLRGQTTYEFFKNVHMYQQKWHRNVYLVFGSWWFFRFIIPIPFQTNEAKSLWGSPTFYKNV